MAARPTTACVVIGRGDDHRVDILLLVEHTAKIFVDGRLGILVDRVGGVALGIDVAQGHDILVIAVADVIAAHASYADAGNVQLLAGGRRIAACQDMPRQHAHGGRRQGCAAQEGAARCTGRFSSGMGVGSHCAGSSINKGGT